MFNLSDVWGPRHLDNFVMQMRLKCRQSELLFYIYNFCKYRIFSVDDNAVLLFYVILTPYPKRIATIADSDSFVWRAKTT